MLVLWVMYIMLSCVLFWCLILSGPYCKSDTCLTSLRMNDIGFFDIFLSDKPLFMIYGWNPFWKSKILKISDLTFGRPLYDLDNVNQCYRCIKCTFPPYYDRYMQNWAQNQVNWSIINETMGQRRYRSRSWPNYIKN